MLQLIYSLLYVYVSGFVGSHIHVCQYICLSLNNLKPQILYHLFFNCDLVKIVARSKTYLSTGNLKMGQDYNANNSDPIETILLKDKKKTTTKKPHTSSVLIILANSFLIDILKCVVFFFKFRTVGCLSLREIIQGT